MAMLFSRALGAAAVALIATSASAHHGWGGNVDQVTSMRGVVVEKVSLAGPHGTMKVKSADGQTWDITLAPPARTSAAGLKPDTIPVGSMVTVRGNRNMDPQRFEMKTIDVEYDGRHYNVYPDRQAFLR